MTRITRSTVALLGAIAAIGLALPGAEALPKRCRSAKAHHKRHCRRPGRRRPAPPRATVASGVHEWEFRILLTRSQVPAGPVLIEVHNDGEDPHDLRLQRADGSGPTYAFSVARPGTSAARTLPLSAGSWRLWCSLPGHAEAGMQSLLTVGG